jgi:integrase
MRGHLQISYQFRGQRFFETLNLRASRSGIEEAARIRRQRIDELRSGARWAQSEYPSIPFSEAAQRYLDFADLALSTRNGYRDALNLYWMPHLRDRVVSGIRAAELRAIDRTTQWPSAKTRKNSVSALRQVFRFSVDEEYSSMNPAVDLRASRAKRDRREPDPYTTAERDTLLTWLEQNCADTVHAYFLVAFSSGMRTGELLALRWDDYDGESLRVNKSRVRRELKGSTKTYLTRRILIPDATCRALNRLPSRFRREEIFLNQYGRPYLSAYHLNQHLERAHAANRIRRRGGPYPWRHTYASIGLTRGARPAFLAKQLGHTLQVFYSTYARWIESEDDRAQLAIVTA